MNDLEFYKKELQRCLERKRKGMPFTDIFRHFWTWYGLIAISVAIYWANAHVASIGEIIGFSFFGGILVVLGYNEAVSTHIQHLKYNDESIEDCRNKISKLRNKNT